MRIVNGFANGGVMLGAVLVVALVARAQSPDVPEAFRGNNSWGGRKAHPAVVNPVGREDDGSFLSLRGTWQFSCAAQNSPGMWCEGTREWGQREIQVPGCWEAQGVGEPGIPPKAQCQDGSPKRLNHVYQGVGLYRKVVTVPAAWKGKRIWIKAGGILAQGWIRVNWEEVGIYNCYGGARKWDITDVVEPGREATVFIVVDNTVPTRCGGLYGGGRYGGIVRDVELEAMPADAWIDDAWVRGDVSAHRAEAHVEIGGSDGLQKDVTVRVSVEGETAEAVLPPSAVAKDGVREVVLSVPLCDFRPWSPEHPNLYWATIELVQDGQVVQTRRERFGVRKFEVRDKQFFLNGKPFFFRGFGDNRSYPITGVSPADRAYHYEHLRHAKAAGYNYVRLHTHCEVPEYMEAADELGLIVQPEVSYYGNYTNDDCEYDVFRDIVDRWTAFRRHPSWGICSQGNEGLFAKRTRVFMYEFLHKLDPDRLVEAQDGAWFDPDSPKYMDFRGGSLSVWPRGCYDPEAFICHEYLNLAVKSDPRGAKKYTGVWQVPNAPEERTAWIASNGLDAATGDLLQSAQNALQAFWIRQGLEQARADPFCDGFCHWTICDTTVRDKKLPLYTGQGLFDPFWDPKIDGLTPQEMSKFNSATAVIVDTEGVERTFHKDAGGDAPTIWRGSLPWEGTNRVYAAGDVIPADFILSYYGEETLVSARLDWAFVGAEGSRIVSGTKNLGMCAPGPAVVVAREKIRVPDVKRPGKYRLEVALRDGGREVVSTSYDFWFFPRRSAKVSAPGVWISKALPTVRARYCDLEENPDAAKLVVAPADDWEVVRTEGRIARRQLTLEGWDEPSDSTLGWWWIGNQCGMLVDAHAMFGDFPHERFLTPLLMRLVKRGGKPTAGCGIARKDLAVIGEGGAACQYYLAETKTPFGLKKIVVSGLDLVSDTVEGAALLDRLIDYACK